MAKPAFDLMWANFPDHARYPTLTTLHTFIGGQLANNIDVPGFGPKGNTCAVRMSRALNYGNMPLSSKRISQLKLSALRGADKKLYLFRVTDMTTYISNALGVSPIIATKNFDKAFTANRGIVAFTVQGWGDASGHLALWNGTSYKEPAYDDFSNLRDNPATPKVEPQTVRMTLWPL
jgi:hypothetical protein